MNTARHIESRIADYLKDRLPEIPLIAVVLGSGLSEFTENISGKISIPYSDIPHYPLPTVTGHVGEFVFGYVQGVSILCARGRFHYYEGHPLKTVTLPIRVFKETGCETVIITNAAGCMNESWKPGDLMIIKGHFDFTFRNGAADPPLRFAMKCYDQPLMDLAREIGREIDIHLHEGNYCWTLGPTYETPAEIRDMCRLGGDAVGMSTVPEIEEAERQGLRLLGISCLTNFAAGISPIPLSHEEVLETTEGVKRQFAELINGIIVNYRQIGEGKTPE